MKDLYIEDVDFGQVYIAYEHPTFNKFYRVYGYLFKEKRLCLSNYFIRELVVRETHRGGLIGQFCHYLITDEITYNIFVGYMSNSPKEIPTDKKNHR
jgi:hypothetical protein